MRDPEAIFLTAEGEVLIFPRFRLGSRGGVSTLPPVILSVENPFHGWIRPPRAHAAWGVLRRRCGAV